MGPILNQAGGLRYHFRALRYRSSLWAPLREALGAWLAEVLPAHAPLLLVAPSGGYCLSAPLLSKYSGRIHAVDWDPLAPVFFKRSHPETSVTWHRLDVMRGGGEELAQILGNLPDATVVFCNFLGQAEIASPQHYTDFAERLPLLLKNRKWVSFHDRYSGEIIPSTHSPLKTPRSRATPQTLLEHFYQNSKPGELNEHSLPKFLEESSDQSHSYWIWPLTPRRFHLLEGIAQ